MITRFNKRLVRLQDRHRSARGLFDKAVTELEETAEELDDLRSSILSEVAALSDQADEAFNTSAQARRVARKIRELTG